MLNNNIQIYLLEKYYDYYIIIIYDGESID